MAVATVTAAPGTGVQLYAYSRPSTTFRLARQVVVPASGSVALPFRAAGSTRLYALQRFCTDVSPSLLLLVVASPVSLAVQRLGSLTYRFSGSTGGAPVATPLALVRRTAAGDIVLTRTTTDSRGRWTLGRLCLAAAAASARRRRWARRDRPQWPPPPPGCPARSCSRAWGLSTATTTCRPRSTRSCGASSPRSDPPEPGHAFWPDGDHRRPE